MNDFISRLETVRKEAIAVVDELVESAGRFELIAPPDALSLCRQKLIENHYQVMVVGEVKRGKSSFVNALIGQEVLPTDVDVATSQVFRIRRAEQEAYRLRFEDGSSQEIGRSDLPRYGSQVVADVEGTPRLDQVIRWIEIEVPVRFLPPEISLLDSPGLGGLYELHAEITLRFIAQADAVIFVLDSSRPIIEEELSYLEKIVDKTRSVFFIQTKIDLFRSTQWQDVRRRNEEILQERLGDRLADVRVWPISSRLLSQAVVHEDPDFEIASKHRELAPAMQEFLMRAAGWTRVAETLMLADSFQRQGDQVLAGRHKTLADESRQEREAVHQQLDQSRKRFLSEWGDRGAKRRELREGVRKVVALGKQHLNQFFARSGDLENSLQADVMAAETLDALRSVADRIPSLASARAMARWREVCDRSWEQCLTLLAPFMQDAEETTAVYRVDTAPNLGSVAGAPNVSGDWYTKMKNARMDFMTGVWAGGVGGSIGGGVLVALGVLATPVIAPLAAVASLIGGLWAAVRGTQRIDQNQLRSAKQEVSRYVEKVCQGIRRHFLDVKVDAGSFGMVDEFFDKMEQICEDQITSLTQKKAAECDAEIERLKQAAEMSDQQRSSQAQSIKQQRVAWNELRRRLDQAGEKLQSLERSFERAESKGAVG